MKFMHLSDLHIGLKLMNRDLAADQRYILDQITELAAGEAPDAVVVAGDLYDKPVPSAEAVDLFDHFIEKLTETLPEAEIMLISGNHDSGPRVNCFRSVLSKQRVHMIGLPPQRENDRIEKVILRDDAGPVNFYLLPFVRPSMVKQITGTDDSGNNLSYEETLRRLIAREEIDTKERNVLVSHQFYLPAGRSADEVERMESEVRTAGNIDAVSADILKPFDYAALGHIHKPMKAGSEILRYCGTPLACSVSEAGQNKGVIMVELSEKPDGSSPGECVRTEVLPLVPLRQIRKISGTPDEVLEQRCDDYVSVTLTGDAGEQADDLQDRLRSAFPYLLEIRREVIRTADYTAEVTPEKQLDPYELCCAFLKEPDEAEQELLKDVINTVRGRNPLLR